MDAPIPVHAANTVDPRFVFERQGKSVVLYQGLLDLAHRQGLRAIRTRLIQVPSPENAQVAICSAEVETERGTFSGIGDASPSNVARPMLTATIRLAETRAKARALRDCVNVGMIAFEELDGETGELTPVPTSSSAPRPAAVAASHAPTPIHDRVDARADARADASAEPATPAQVRAIEKLAADGGVPTEGLLKICRGLGFASPETATRGQAAKVIALLQNKADAR